VPMAQLKLYRVFIEEADKKTEETQAEKD
jgi:hypothetical protein